MMIYQILSEMCFIGFIVNTAYIIYLHYFYVIPKHLERYTFLSLFKNIVGAITQLYVTPLECSYAWYIKGFAIAVVIASFTFCFDVRHASIKKR